MKWSLSEEIVIKNNYLTKTYKEIAELLPNRTYGAVGNKARKIGLKKYGNGVKYKHSNGYIIVRRDDYPRDWAGSWRREFKSTYVYEHCVVWWENNPDDKIERDEIIHHLDGNRANNSIANLEKMKRGLHSTITLMEQYGDIPGVEAMNAWDL